MPVFFAFPFEAGNTGFRDWIAADLDALYSDVLKDTHRPPLLHALYVGASLERKTVTSALRNGRNMRAESAVAIGGDFVRLPFGDQIFDLVIGAFGAMSATDPDKLHSEMLRVCRKGGQLLFANWTPGGTIGHMLRLISKFTPLTHPTWSAQSSLWGDEEAVDARMRAYAARIRYKRWTRRLGFARSPRDVATYLSSNCPQMRRVYEFLDPDKKREFLAYMEDFWARHNIASGAKTEVLAEYLVVTAVRV